MKPMHKRGIVAKIAAQSCIILTPEGTYEKIPIPSRPVRVGTEISYRSPRFAWPYKTLLMVASLLIVFMGYPLIDQAMLPQAAAYVSLDINSSLEMAVDKNMQVIDVRCFDDQASDLVKSLDLKGKSLPEAMEEVVNQAIAQNYLQSGQENLMVSTVSPSELGRSDVDEAMLYQVLAESMTNRGYSGEVKVYTVDPDFHRAAENKEMSAGKYLVYEQAVRSGHSVNEEDMDQYTVGQLADNYQVNFLPNYKKVMIQEAAAGGGSQITVEDNGNSIAIEEYSNSRGSRSGASHDSKNQAAANVSRAHSTRPTGAFIANSDVPVKNQNYTDPGKSLKKLSNPKIDKFDSYLTGKNKKI